jgi:Histidine kinase-like ATPase domain
MRTSPPMPGADGQLIPLQIEEGVLLEMRLPSDPALFGVVRATVNRLGALLVRHSYHGRPDQPLAIQFRRLLRGSDTSLEVLLWDQGPAIDASQLRERDPEELRPGGLGLRFIREAMDTVEFHRQGNANRLRMIKHLVAAGPGRTT